jgi:chemotaxis protein methyltransferase CheR
VDAAGRLVISASAADDVELRLLLEAIHLSYQYDFRAYAQASLKRRLATAMVRLRCPTLAALQARVIHDASAFTQLLDYLTVQVSEFFRDPLSYRAFRARVVPVLRTYPSFRVWVAGCSTGEEAWSLAMLLREEGLLDRALIYATDINGAALEKAEAGVYGLERLPQLTENHRRTGASGPLVDAFTTAYGQVRFDQALRRHLVFSDHSLATDTVFAEVQLVSCRNVLIYFDRALQDRAVDLFHEALSHKGFLTLGAKESLRFSKHATTFRELDRDQRLYQKGR